MDEQLMAAVIAVLVAAAGWLKSHTEVNAVKRDRESTKFERDTKIALLESKVVDMEKRLNDGNNRFDRIERELKETNGLLRELLGMFRVSNPGAALQPVRTYQDVVDREG